MVASLDVTYCSPEDYLAREEDSQVKHEYRDGDVYAMAGASNTHVTIAGNLFALLRGHIRGSGCRSYISDTKVRVENTNSYYYPDVVVSCDRRDREFETFLKYPCLIVEVLSEATEGFDRGDKFADYRTLETLQEYVLISQKRQQVEVYRRGEDGQWILKPYGAGDTVKLASINLSGAIADIYEDVDFPAASEIESETDTPAS